MKSAITLKRSRLQKRISFKKLDISHQKEKLEEKAPHTQNKFFKKVQLRMWINVQCSLCNFLLGTQAPSGPDYSKQTRQTV